MIIPDINSIPPKRPKPNEDYIIEFVRSRIAEDFKGLPIKKEMIEINEQTTTKVEYPNYWRSEINEWKTTSKYN